MTPSIGTRPKDRAELADPLHQVVVLVLQPLALEPGQRAEAHLEDRVRLQLAEPELRHQALRAASVLSEARISAMTASMLSSAIR